MKKNSAATAGSQEDPSAIPLFRVTWLASSAISLTVACLAKKKTRLSLTTGHHVLRFVVIGARDTLSCVKTIT